MKRNADVIVIDIETHPTTDPYQLAVIEREAREARPASNARVALKAEWDKPAASDARASEAISKTAVDTSIAEVLCVALVDPGIAGGIKAFSAMGADNDERQCLDQLSAHLAQISGPLTIWAGHNIKGFDLQVLLNRWRRWGITPPDNFPMFRGGRWEGNIYDTMSEFPCKTGYISLSNASRLLGLSAAKSLDWNGEPMTGARVKAAFDAGEYSLLVDYCACDVQAELALYNAMTFNGAWGVKPRPHFAVGGVGISETFAKEADPAPISIGEPDGWGVPDPESDALWSLP